jgi:hypothetical protein
MVVIYRIGRIPVTYSANWFSIATLISLILYVAVVIFPYLLCGWSLNFFPPFETIADSPTVFAYPNMLFKLYHNSTMTPL